MLVMIEKAMPCDRLCGERVLLEFEQGVGRVKVWEKFTS